MTQTAEQIAFLSLEILAVAAVVLLLFRLRHLLGLLPLAAFVGSNQYLQTILSSTLYVRFDDRYLVSPGSAVLFPSALFAVLLVYSRDGVPKARALIWGVLISNVTMTGLSYVTSLQIRAGGVANFLGVPATVFQVDYGIFLLGTSILLLDTLLILIVYELLRTRARFLPQWVRIPLTLLLVLSFDSLAFVGTAFFGQPTFQSILISQLVSKNLAGVVYGLALFGYLRFVEPLDEGQRRTGMGNSVLAILTYRERYQRLREQKRAQQEAFERERAERKAVEHLKDQFIATVSHELRTPLTSIYGALNLLSRRQDELPEKDRKYLDVALRNARRLTRLINDVLDFRKIGSGHLELELEPHDLDAQAARAIDDLRDYAERFDVAVARRPPADATLARVDRHWLNLVLTNLLSNAIKHSPRGGEVTVAVERLGERARVSVSDRGPGVPESFRGQLFQPFAQANPGSEKGGTGLGLAIAKTIVDRTGGTIGFRDRDGGGATFFVELPLETARVEAPARALQEIYDG